MNKRFGIALATCAVLLAGCGGGDGGGRPSVDEISEALQGGSSVTEDMGIDVDAETADCMAEAFHDSDVSDEALRAMVDGDEGYEGDEDDAAAFTAAGEDMIACVTPDAGADLHQRHPRAPAAGGALLCLVLVPDVIPSGTYMCRSV